jgi:hypothetical protein
VCFAAITLCVASQRVFVVVVCFVIDPVEKLLDTASYLMKLFRHAVDSLRWGSPLLLQGKT